MRFRFLAKPFLVSLLLVLNDPAIAGDIQVPTFITAPDQNLSSLATGDFNNDGKSDIVVQSGNGISVFLSNADGSFASPITSPGNLSGGGQTLIVADVNGDGKLDVVARGFIIAASQDTITVFLGHGDGTFSAPILTPTDDLTTGSGFRVSAMAAGDFSGDGIPDLVASEDVGLGVSNPVVVFVGTGDGTFHLAPGSVASRAFSISSRAFVCHMRDAGLPWLPRCRVCDNLVQRLGIW